MYHECPKILVGVRCQNKFTAIFFKDLNRLLSLSSGKTVVSNGSLDKTKTHKCCSKESHSNITGLFEPCRVDITKACSSKILNLFLFHDLQESSMSSIIICTCVQDEHETDTIQKFVRRKVRKEHFIVLSSITVKMPPFLIRVRIPLRRIQP